MPTSELKQKIAHSFGGASNSYDKSARLQRYSGQLILNSLPQCNDSLVVDLGSGTGFFTDILSRKYKRVIGLDLSAKMLCYAQSLRSNNIQWLNADIHHLPLQSDSVDVIYSNLALQWCHPLQDALEEIKRVLKPGGTAVFTSLVDGTLSELKQAWSSVDNDDHVINFKSHTEIESDILDSGLSIIDFVQIPLVLDYLSVKHLAQELKDLGANHVPTKTHKGLSGKSAWQKMVQAYSCNKNEQSTYPATYQLCTAYLIK